MLLALLGATAGQGVVWYTGQFYALFFLQITLKLDYQIAYTLIAISLVIGTPFFIFFGWLSDKIGRKNIIMAGCLLAVLTYFPLFKGLTHYVNPDLEAAAAKTPISVAANDCHFHIFVGPWSKFTECDKAKDFLTKQGISFTSLPGVEGETVVTKIGDVELKGWDEAAYKEALKAAGFPAKADIIQGQLVHDRADPGHSRHLRDDGIRPDRRIPGGAVPGADTLHLHVTAISHRQWLVRRHAAAAGHRDGGGIRATSTTASGIPSWWPR